MNSIFESVSTKSDFAIIIHGKSIEFGADWTFEYIDIGAEFQFLVIKLLKQKGILSDAELSSIFGLPRKLTPNLLLHMKNNKIIKSVENDKYELTSNGHSIDSSKKITEKEISFFVSEICLTSNSFLGQSYAFIDKEKSNLRDTAIPNIKILNNRPDNSISCDLSGYIINNYLTFTILSNSNPITVVSESGKQIRLSDGINDTTSKFRKLQRSLMKSNDWMTNCKRDYQGVTIHNITEYEIELEVCNYSRLDKITRVVADNLVQIVLLDNQREDLSYIKSTKIIGYDYDSAILLLLKILKSKSKGYWEDLFSNFIQIHEIWVNCYKLDTERKPASNELIEVAIENELFELVRNLRSMEDIYAETYRRTSN